MKYASVSDVVRRIKADIHGDYRLQSVAMEGNVINLKRASNGHYYLNLRDDACSIRAIVFRSRVTAAVRALKEGDHVVVIGAVNVYEKGGALSFLIEQLFSQGVGSLQAEYERIKQDLAGKGYFDAAHKKSLPRFPWRVGVLTSATGAVLHDIHKIAAERNPYAQIDLYPVPVQGEGAAEKIAAAIHVMGKCKDLDVLIVGRGGGSMEDLWCFNSPAVVRAIYRAQVPVITAIGHETDTTLADYAADVRAATPTHAAELAFFDVRETAVDLLALEERAREKILAAVAFKAQGVENLRSRLQLSGYQHYLALQESEVRRLKEKAGQLFTAKLLEKTSSVKKLTASLTALDPENLSRRGYGQLLQKGVRVTSVHDVQKDLPLTIELADGTLTAVIKGVKLRGKNDG